MAISFQTVLDTAYDSLEQGRVQSAVVGSVATVLQGCQISPNDLDLLAKDPEGVFRFAELMSAFAATDCEVESPAVGPWRSTKDVPVFVGSFWGLDWHSACWNIEDFEVLAVHIIAPGGHPEFRDSDGVWECDPEIWPHISRIPFAGYNVPVVPLELQLETNLIREQFARDQRLKERIDAIIGVFKEQGYDRGLLEWSLRREHIEMFDKRMQEG